MPSNEDKKENVPKAPKRLAVILACVFSINAFLGLFQILHESMNESSMVMWSGLSLASALVVAGFLGAFAVEPLAPHQPIFHVCVGSIIFWLGSAARGFYGLTLFSFLFELDENELMPWYIERLGYIALTIPGAVLGGYASIQFLNLVRRHSNRENWELITDDGRAITCTTPGQNRLVARLYLGFAVAFFILPFSPMLLTFSGAQRNPLWQNAVGAFVFLGLVCYILYRRYGAPSAERAMKNDARAPIVYLRSFADDGRTANEGIWYEFTQSLRSLIGRTWEQRLAKLLRNAGPFVAIGRPGEELPHLGAARMYVKDEDWQNAVKDFLSKAQLVILQAGQTAGLRWEFEAVGAQLQPENVLLYIPFPIRKMDKQRQLAYQLFHEWAHDALPASLPPTVDDTFFVFFKRSGDAWSAHDIDSAFPLQSNTALKDHPKHDLLTRIAKDRSFRRSPGFSVFTKVLIAILAVITLPAWPFIGLGVVLGLLEGLLPLFPV